MDPYLSVILWTAGIILLFILLMAWNNHKWKMTQERRIRRIFGTVPEREYSRDELDQISHYFRRKMDGEFCIDDITWNDLDMDRIFMMMNQTMSSPGEDVLYEMLRRPLFSREEIREREKLITFFESHEKERSQMQLMLSGIGKTRLGSLADTILALNDAPKISLPVHIIMLAALLISLLMVLPLNPLAGFLLFFCFMTVNVAIYYGSSASGIIDVYMECFSRLMRMLDTADQFKTVKWPEVKKQMDAIDKSRRSFVKFRRKAIFLTGKNADSGDPLQLVLSYIRMVFHIDILFYNSILKEVQDKSPEIMSLIDNMGELDAAISIASFRHTLPIWCTPDFISYHKGEPVRLSAEGLYHPLISEPVANSIDASGGILITGSNASGKSTFLKNIAINSILAQTVNTCTCKSCTMPFLKVMTSMALRDDLERGESYFIVEIRSLKRILDESTKEEPLLCIVDEVLRGTNTIERIAASSEILKELTKKHVLAFAATHDIELTYILDGIYSNYHFEEEIRDHEVVFNYLLQKGPATTRNAIRLLDMLGYDPKLVKSATEAAATFQSTGVWKALSGTDTV